MEKYEWEKAPPKENGDFFYAGSVPDGEEVLAIVQVFTDLATGERMACLFIPPGWRGDDKRTSPVIHFGALHKWIGKWAGPEFGLCCVSA